MKTVFIVLILLIAADAIISLFLICSQRKDRRSKERLIDALYANRDAQQAHIRELKRRNTALEHLLDLCLKQEKKEEDRHDRSEDEGN